jgi:hypothetical protein
MFKQFADQDSHTINSSHQDSHTTSSQNLTIFQRVMLLEKKLVCTFQKNDTGRRKMSER